MKQFYHLFYKVSVLLSLSLYSLDAATPSMAPNQQEYSSPFKAQGQEGLEAVIEGNSRFAFDLYRHFKDKKNNLFFSPFSISTAFTLALSGAKSETAIEMQKVLRLPLGWFPLEAELLQELHTPPNKKADAVQLFLANALWVQKGLPLLPSFQQTLTNVYQVTPQMVDFTKEPWNAVKVINQWVTDRTNGKINQLLTTQDISNQTRLVLTSAIYMKAPWLHVFDARQTTKQSFYSLGHRTFQVLMMKIVDQYPLFVGTQFAMIEIPYKNEDLRGSQLAMMVLLPKEEIELDTLEQELTFDNWINWLSQLKLSRVNLMFPKFRLEDRIELNPILKELGMIKAFSPLADFSGITGQKNLFINSSVHKTFLKVDEQGSEAAAATGISMNLTSILNPEEPYNFIVNRPFAFLIIDKKTNSILFMGRVVQP